MSSLKQYSFIPTPHSLLTSQLLQPFKHIYASIQANDENAISLYLDSHVAQFIASYLPCSGLFPELQFLKSPLLSARRSSRSGLLHYATEPLAFEGALLPDAARISHTDSASVSSFLPSIPFKSHQQSCNQRTHHPVADCNCKQLFYFY